MRIEIKSGNLNQKKQIKLDSGAILGYLIGNNENIDTMIMCKNPDVNLITSDNNVYEALGSLKPYDNFKINKLTKLFENVDVSSYKDVTGGEKPVLTFERVEKIRHNALKK